MLGAYHDIVSRLDRLAWWKANSILLYNLFNDSLRDARASPNSGSETPRPGPETKMLQAVHAEQKSGTNESAGIY
jgi:hypothetical protein